MMIVSFVFPSDFFTAVLQTSEAGIGWNDFESLDFAMSMNAKKAFGVWMQKYPVCLTSNLIFHCNSDVLVRKTCKCWEVPHRFRIKDQ